MATQSSGERKKLLTKACAAGAVLVAAAVLVLRGVDVRGWLERGVEALREAGPWAFFLAMTLLPAAGMPVLAFSLTAGRAFGGRMGMGWVVAAGLAATTVNMLLTYWLARWALRPWISRLVARLGYRLPELDGTDKTDLIVLLRVTPGIPFFVQNYLLGLADVPAGRYAAISCAVIWAYTSAAIVFGEALLGGRGRVALVAVGLLVALAALSHLVRHHMAKAGKAA